MRKINSLNISGFSLGTTIGVQNVAGVPVNPSTEESLLLLINAVLAGGSSTLPYGEIYSSPQDFTATYTSSNTLTITGSSFSIDDSTCFVGAVVAKRAAGTWVSYINAQNGVNITASSNVVTVTLTSGLPFVNTDTAYKVIVFSQEKAYDSSTDTEKVTLMNPENQNYVQDSLVDTTNVAAATVYYPSSTGMSMDGFKDFSLTGKIIEGDAVTDTIQVEVTNDEDPATADWIVVYGFRVDTNAMVNIITTGGVAGTYTFALDFDNLNFSYVRVKTVVADATNTWIIKSRRK